MNLVLKEFLQTLNPPLTSVLYAKGYHDFPLKHSAKKFRRGTRLCFRKFRVSKNFMPKRGISRFSIEKLLSHSTEKLRRRPFVVSQNFWYRKKIMDKRGGGRRREYYDFLSKTFCPTVPKNFVGEPFSVSLISGVEKLYT